MQRNYYRVLHVQPDAPPAAIRASYRTLLQKLRAHPDLGGDHLSAALINEAYAALKDPGRRARYDAELLARYDIRTLGSGARIRRREKDPQRADANGNRRNFYRVLQVQRDAPHPLIDAGYRTTIAIGRPPAELAVAAYRALGDPERRARYDRILAAAGHPAAARALAAGEPGRDRPYPERIRLPRRPTEGGDAAPFVPSITRYCRFCKSPAPPPASGPADRSRCIECASPLPDREAAAAGRNGRRDAARHGRDIRLTYRTYWPGPPHRALVQDLSPTGIGLSLEQPLATGDVIKLEAEEFSAVGTVTRCQPRGPAYAVGIRFTAIAFARACGNFFSATV